MWPDTVLCLELLPINVAHCTHNGMEAKVCDWCLVHHLLLSTVKQLALGQQARTPLQTGGLQLIFTGAALGSWGPFLSNRSNHSLSLWSPHIHAPWGDRSGFPQGLTACPGRQLLPSWKMYQTPEVWPQDSQWQHSAPLAKGHGTHSQAWILSRWQV